MPAYRGWPVIEEVFFIEVHCAGTGSRVASYRGSTISVIEGATYRGSTVSKFFQNQIDEKTHELYKKREGERALSEEKNIELKALSSNFRLLCK